MRRRPDDGTTRWPKGDLQRVVATSRGPALLQVLHVQLGSWVSVSVFSDDGWEEPSRRLVWSPPSRRRGDYVSKGGRDSLPETIEAATGVPLDEAEPIAEALLREWPIRVAGDEIARSRGGSTELWVFLGVLAVLALGSLALFAVVLTHVF